jgi:hypothetical protein
MWQVWTIQVVLAWEDVEELRNSGLADYRQLPNQVCVSPQEME